MLGHSGGVPGVISVNHHVPLLLVKSTTRSGTVSCCECVCLLLQDLVQSCLPCCLLWTLDFRVFISQ
jgi:hypothetical protein